MNISSLITVPYYHTPAWLTILVDGLRQSGCVTMLKHSERDEATGLYRFRASYGEESGREEILYVWTATPEQVYEHLRIGLGDDWHVLKLMVEEYASERKDREETKVYRGIIQLIIGRAVEIFAQQSTEIFEINGDFTLIGRLPPNGSLRVNGRVKRVEGSTGKLLQIKHEHCPVFCFSGIAMRTEGMWTILRTVPNCVMPPG